MDLSVRPVVATVLVLATAACGSSHPYPFEKPARVDGAAIEVTVIVNTCTRLDRIEVDETEEQVLVTAIVREEGTSCDDMGIPITGRVSLRAPVAGRVVVDGACAIERYQSYVYCGAD